MTDVGEEALHLLKVPQVAERLGVSLRAAWRLVGSGELKSVRIGRSRRVVPEDLAAFVDGLRRAAPR